ncbi:MAG: ankyrin repeat domain-containing protein [Planctomycetota bacterium]
MSADRERKLVDAIIAGDAKKASLYLKAGLSANGVDGRGDSFLRTAARFGQAELFELLLERGADVHEPELLEWSVDGDGGRREIAPEITERILSDAEPTQDELDASLRIACVSGNLRAIELLLKHGANPNGLDPRFHDFPLLNAVVNEHKEAVVLLLARGADPNLHPVKEENDHGTFVVKGALTDEPTDPAILALLQQSS